MARPAPAQPVADRMRAWLDWFGVARLAVSAASMLVVCAGAFWLVRTPSPPAEAVVPRASSAGIPVSTLAVPGTADGGTSNAAAMEYVVVHVAGAVVRPDVYRLQDGDRVDDALRAAGGPTAAADLDALNLAAVVADGARVYVPVEGETPPVLPLDDSGASDPAPVGPIDINRADADLLDSLPGVGPATAAAIVAERERNGPFLGVDDLERVPGIGPAKLAGLRDLVVA